MQRMDSTSASEPDYHFQIHPARNADADDPENWHYIYYANPPEARVMSFKGGGSRVLVYIKFLEVAHRLGLLNAVQEVGGSSSGSIAAAFAALYYEDPLTRTEALEEITNCDRYDIYGETAGWVAYQTLTSPLFLVSKPLEWISKVIGWIAKQCNKVTPGKIIGIPLIVISALLNIASTMTSPRFIPGIFNLAFKGGVYRGDVVEKTTRERFHKDTHAGLHAILARLRKEGNEVKRNQIIDRVVNIGLGKRENGRLILTPEITLAHLYELSVITDYQFKAYYCTTVRVSDNSLVVLNHINAPDLPAYKAVRLAITFPLYYVPVSVDGETYIDGGAINNAPVGLATVRPVTETHAELDASDHLSRLNIRVEYPKEYKNHLWHKTPAKGKFNQFIHTIKVAFAKRLTGGVDVFATDEQVTHAMQTDYAQRTVQIPDFGIGQMEDNLGKKRRQKIDVKIESLVKQHFAHHQDEKIWKRYAQPTAKSHDMPPNVRRKLLDTLRNPEIKTGDIFIFPGKSSEELALMRSIEIERLCQVVTTNTAQESTSIISQLLQLNLHELTPTVANDNNVVVLSAERLEQALPDNDEIESDFNEHICLLSKISK